MNLTGKLKTNDDMDRDIEEGASTQTWYRRTAELGLALAIILNKPPEQSGRQYTEYLVTRLQSRDESWKAKAEELQEKVLQLQQELFLTKMLSRPESRGERGESSVEILSQDVLCSTSHEPNPEEDSGCDTGNTGSLLPSQELGDLAVQQASSRREVAFGAWNFESKKVKAVHFHTKFLRNVLGLRRIKELGNATPDPLASDQNYSIIRDSVCQLLDCVSFLYRDCKAALPSSLLLEAGQTAASAVERGRLCEQACTQFVKKMEEFLKEFTGLILENNQLNRFQTQESIADFLILLGRSSLLKSSFVCHLLSEISHFADEVQQSCQNQSQKLPEFDIARYENTFYLFWILEQLLQTDERGDGPLPQDLSELRVWHQRLQKNFLCLSDEFPLFAIYMWRIGAYLCTDTEIK